MSLRKDYKSLTYHAHIIEDAAEVKRKGFAQSLLSFAHPWAFASNTKAG